MTALIVPRGVVTDSFIDYMTSRLDQNNVPILVGDGEKPEDAGWPKLPGEGKFQAYVTVQTGVGQPAPREAERLSGQHSAWSLAYQIKHFGGTRTQTDWCADMIRAVVIGFDTDKLPAEFGWAVESVTYPSLGGVPRNDAVTPPEWSITEDALIRVTRGRRD